MMLDGGYWTMGRISGVPIRLHWSIPLGALLSSRGTFAPGIWLGFFAVVLLHELGHAYLVKRRGLGVLAIDVHALGGVCRWTGRATALDVSIIAWGGVLAQACVLVAVLLLLRVVPMRGAFLSQLSEALIVINATMIVLNLVPIRPFDGAEAWRIFGRWRGSAPPSPRPVVTAKRPPVRAAIRKEDDDDDSLPPMPGDIKDEMERIVREATLARRRGSGRNDPS